MSSNKNNLITVTVSVETYNSSQYVVETLESIKAQTYPNLFLRICDDCSTDNTIAVCKDWINKNKDRFIGTDIVVSPVNTGVSANCNRSWDSCTTKYQKNMAGDDILLPNCICDNMSFVEDHPDAVMIFSRMKSFGSNLAECAKIDSIYNYEYFTWTPDKQYQYLYDGGCCVPAPTCFVNIEEIRKIGLRHDERIPMQEDVAKWFNALKLGIRFSFFDKLTVKYRIHSGSLSTAYIPSPLSRESVALTWFYYHFVPEYEKDPENAIRLAVAKELEWYKLYYKTTNPIINSKRYRTMMAIMTPLDTIRTVTRNVMMFFTEQH